MRFLLLLLLPTAAMSAMIEVSLAPASGLGLTGVSVNARVLTAGAPGRFWVEYGRAGRLDRSTPPAPLPPARAAYLVEDWDTSCAGWSGGLTGHDLVHQAGAAGKGYVRYLGPQESVNRAFPGEPPGFDPNHLDGIGGLNLCAYIYSARLGGNPVAGTFGTGLGLGGGRPDLRDAVIELRLRGQAFDPRGAELVFWAQSDHDPAVQRTPHWVRANWAFTGQPLTRHVQAGPWQDVAYVLENNSTRWSYAGNNLTQARAERYAYQSLDQSLADLNANFFHLLAFVDRARPPTGQIDFDRIAIRYRNHSLLLPRHGATVVAAPAGAQAPASALTDGWRHGPGREWISPRDPAGPQVLTWKFARPVHVRVLQVHQARHHPAKDLEAHASRDGVTWRRLAALVLPPASAVSPNHNFGLVDLDEPGISFFRITVQSGHEAAAWALGEVEVFGTGAAWATDTEATNLNADLPGLEPGAAYTYRFAVETADGIHYSPTGIWQTPADDRPSLTRITRRPNGGGAADLWVRVNPLGHPTVVHLERMEADAWVAAAPAQPAGRQVTERDLKFAPDPGAGAGHPTYRVVLESRQHRVVSAPLPLDRIPFEPTTASRAR